MIKKKNYQGHLLVANPNNPKDYLHQAVILIVTHTESLGIGLQINNPNTSLSLATIGKNIGVPFDQDYPIYYGGNISVLKIHVVHSLDWMGPSTVELVPGLGITNDVSVLAAVSRGEGPEHFRACAGYWLWEGGVLDQMLDPRDHTCTEPYRWEIAPATTRNVFLSEGEEQWEEAIEESAKFNIANWI